MFNVRMAIFFLYLIDSINIESEQQAKIVPVNSKPNQKPQPWSVRGTLIALLYNIAFCCL